MDDEIAAPRSEISTVTSPGVNSTQHSSLQTAKNNTPNNGSAEVVERGHKGHNVTELLFRCLVDRSNVAKVGLLLCNISDRPLYYRLRSNMANALSALPSATGHVAPRCSSRIVLTWTRPKEFDSWAHAPGPKLLLVTRFLDGDDKGNDETTSTRMIGVVDVRNTCTADTVPLEQLLLDAASKNIALPEPEKEVQTVVVERQTHSPTPSSGMPDNQMLLYALLVLVCLVLARLIFTPREHAPVNRH